MGLYKVGGQKGGKTTAMVKVVTEAVARGESVIVVVANGPDADRLRTLLPKGVRIVWKAEQVVGCRGDAYVDNHAWDTMNDDLFSALERMGMV